MKKFCSLLNTAAWLLPPGPVKNRILRAFGHRVHPSARIGICLFLGHSTVDIGRDSVIGHGNAFRGLSDLRLGDDALIGQLNWFSAAPTLRLEHTAGHGRLSLADHAVITNRHYVDCSGGVVLGEFATIAGVRCTVLSHTIDLDACRQTVAAVRLFDNAFACTNSVLLPGTTLAPCAVLATGSVTTLGTRYEGNMLHGGVPAKAIKPIDGAYFRRSQAWVAH